MLDSEVSLQHENKPLWSCLSNCIILLSLSYCQMWRLRHTSFNHKLYEKECRHIVGVTWERKGEEKKSVWLRVAGCMSWNGKNPLKFLCSIIQFTDDAGFLFLSFILFFGFTRSVISFTLFAFHAMRGGRMMQDEKKCEVNRDEKGRNLKIFLFSFFFSSAWN